MMGHARHYKDRRDAGRQLASALTSLRPEQPIVLALPRGGVPVAYEVALALEAPLDVILVRKIGAPGFPELGLGAVVDGAHPQLVLNEDLIRRVNPPPGYLESEERRQLLEIERRRKIYCGDSPPLKVEQATVIVVDDGIATGGTMMAALKALASEGVARLVVAVPVASREAIAGLTAQADDVVCLLTPPDFRAVGSYYDDFEQTSDDEVVALLEAARNRTSASAAARTIRPNFSDDGNYQAR